jgi:predicted esterase
MKPGSETRFARAARTMRRARTNPRVLALAFPMLVAGLQACGDTAAPITQAPGMAPSVNAPSTGSSAPAMSPGGAGAMAQPVMPSGTPPAPQAGGAGMGAQPTPAVPAPPATGASPLPPAMQPAAMPGGTVDSYVPWDPVCPAGFTPQSGMNSGFMTADGERQFSVFLPSDVDTPRPVFLSLTGTEQSESAFMTQAGVSNLPNMGFIVIAPVRTCTSTRTNCNGWGDDLTNDGRLWEPWFDGSNREEFRQDEGPDVRFFEAMVKCVASGWPVDPKQIYLGGISAGGTITNRNMTFNSDFFAGGVNGSGAWYSVVGSIRTQPEDEVEDEGEGWCCPRPFHTMDSSIVINVWGGTRDTWANRNIMPPVDVDFGVETKRAAEYYASQEKVLTVSCSGSQAHSWPSGLTNWLATTLLSYPKGSDPSSFQLMPPPSGFTCTVGEYTDH